MFGYFSEITEPERSIYQNNSIKKNHCDWVLGLKEDMNVKYHRLANYFSSSWPFVTFLKTVYFMIESL